jgi:hypothetical protein
MAIGYFAEIKGVVGYQYKPQLAFKVRELNWFGIELCKGFYDP